MHAAVDVDDPKVRVAAVLLDVHEIPHVDDLLAIRGNLRIGGVFQLEHIHQLEPGDGLVAGWRGRCDKDCQDDGRNERWGRQFHGAALPSWYRANPSENTPRTNPG